MQVTVTDVSTVKKILHVSVPAETVTEKLEKVISAISKKSKIKGFRPGKAPRSVIERMYKEEIKDEVTQAIIGDSLPAAITETKLKVVGRPHVDPPVFEQGKSYDYAADLETLPPIETIDVSGLSLKKTNYVATDKEIEIQIEMLRKNMSKLIPLEEDRAAQHDDFVLICYEGVGEHANDPNFAKTDNFSLQIGAGKVVKDFEAGVTGMKKGETRVFPVSFPEDYFNQEMAGKTVEFSITVKDIRKEILPEADDEFAKTLGPFGTIGDLRDIIRKNLQDGYDKRREQELDEQIYQALLDRTPFETPECLVQREMDLMVEDYEKTLEHKEVKLSDLGITREMLAARYMETAERQVRRYIVLDHLIEQLGTTLPDGEMDAAFDDMAKSLNLPADRIKAFYQGDQDRLEAFVHTLLQKEVLKQLRAGATIEEVEPVLEEATAS